MPDEEKKMRSRVIMLTIAAMSVMSASAVAQETIETRIGKLTLESGYPSPETVQRAYDDADLNRAVQAYGFFLASAEAPARILRA